jgi:hypothetical protein
VGHCFSSHYHFKCLLTVLLLPLKIVAEGVGLKLLVQSTAGDTEQ